MILHSRSSNQQYWISGTSPKGYSGFSGYSGISGSLDYDGYSGYTGVSGPSGSQGHEGFIGDTMARLTYNMTEAYGKSSSYTYDNSSPPATINRTNVSNKYCASDLYVADFMK